MAKLEQLKFDDKNFNKHTQFGLGLLEQSLRKNGAGRSILIDKNNRIIAGNGVAEVAGQIGMDDVQIVETDGTKIIAVKRTDIDLDSKQGREMALADNAVAHADLDWDTETLADVADDFDINVGDWGVELEEFNDDEPATTEAHEDDFDEETDAIQVKCQRGDVWQLGEHRLMCGDSIDLEDVKRLMGGGKIDMVLTDPPYNVAIGAKNRALQDFGITDRNTDDLVDDQGKSDDEVAESLWIPAFKNAREVANDCCSIYITMPQGGTHMMMMMSAHKAGWQVKHELIWEKNQPTFSMGRLDYDYKHEPICYGWNKSHKFYGDKTDKSILCFDRPRKSKEHPTMKPVELFARLICNSSKDGDAVLDLFGGSGTTLIACEQLHRKCFMMEFDQHYCDVIIARWEKLTGKQAVKLEANNEQR